MDFHTISYLYYINNLVHKPFTFYQNILNIQYDPQVKPHEVLFHTHKYALPQLNIFGDDRL